MACRQWRLFLTYYSLPSPARQSRWTLRFKSSLRCRPQIASYLSIMLFEAEPFIYPFNKNTNIKAANSYSFLVTGTTISPLPETLSCAAFAETSAFSSPSFKACV